MPQPSPNLITSTRWRSADALLAIAEDPKASARERRLAAMAVLDLCDKAEAAIESQSASQSPRSEAGGRVPSLPTVSALPVAPQPAQVRSAAQVPRSAAPTAAALLAESATRSPAPTPPALAPIVAAHTQAQPRAA